MLSTRIALLGVSAVVAAGLVALYLADISGKTDADKPAAIANIDTSVKPAAPTEPAAEPAASVPSTGTAPTQQAAMPQPELTTVPPSSGAPTFDVLRVEPTGSIVIAGKASANATVDLLSRSKVIGTTKSNESGDFVIVLEDPLKPGDYQLVLRSTGASGTAMTSIETAIVSIPESKTGQVLALVEQSGQPSRMITTPAATPAPDAAQAVVTAAPKGDKPVVQPAVKARIAVEAVEIEGNKLFIAGTAEAGLTVKVYANSDLLGSTMTTPEGRFLVQTVKELAVGDYIVRADMLAADGVTVLARSAVPFKREAGERVSAVAAAPKADEPVQAESATAQAATGDAAAPLQSVEGSVIIRRGDNLWRISRRTYGEGMRYTTIYLANKEQIRNPNRIFPGQVFALPETDKPAVQ
ncbi:MULTISPECIES: LysM peptidoglycan-binding domain-containing protein [unclassified Phyllobacterium]|uniref:LysM peptidoglycan-binding domain-containing protein n=1 Tax=unclassified Phyllobacterium TaxID=2638441 RepID=UPI003012EC3B